MNNNYRNSLGRNDDGRGNGASGRNVAGVSYEPMEDTSGQKGGSGQKTGMEWLDDDCVLMEIWDATPREKSEESTAAFNRFWTEVSRRRRTPFIKTARIYSYAAAVLLPIVAGLIFFFSHKESPTVEYAEIVVPYGQTDSIRLADNSLVWLNSGSRLIYPRSFDGDDRKVFLSGEGFFEVAKNPVKPFIVSAGDVNVRVLGTKFDFSSYENAENVYVSLVEGSVCFGANRGDSSSEMLMKPGEIVEYVRSSGEMRLSSGSASAMSGWRDGGYYFENRTLQDIVSCLERSFNVDIKIGDMSIADVRYSLAFVNNESLDRMLDAIAYNGKLSVTKSADGYLLSRLDR